MGLFETFQQTAARAQQALEADRKKIGGMHAGGMARQGLAELRQAVSFDGTIAQPTVHGIFGVSTPGEVAAARQDDGNVYGADSNNVESLSAQDSPLSSAQRQAASSGGSVRQRDGQGLD